MKYKKLVLPLVVINLALIAIHFFIKLPFINKIFSSLCKLVIVPIFISLFIFYLLKPLNDSFNKKGLKNNFSATLTLIIAILIVFGVVRYLGYYFIEQLNNLINKLIFISKKDSVLKFVNKNLLNNINIKWMLEQILLQIKNYIYYIGNGALKTANCVMSLFSNLLLVVIIVFYLLKDGEKLRNKILDLIPRKYRDKYEDKFKEILLQSDNVLSNYVVGQAKVALSLATMIYIGYLIIGMPGGLILASITFILAFIPFVGFFISMIIPYIIAISIGFRMVIKLSILFIVAQTLKGRLVVPIVMSKTMKIHPITDIFLVITAAAILGPIGAFIIVPLYSVIKISINIFKSDNPNK